MNKTNICTAKACHVCLKCEPDVNLKSLFDGCGELAEIFQIIADIDISKEGDAFNAWICEKCCKTLTRAYNFREKARKNHAIFCQTPHDETTEETEIASDNDIVFVREYKPDVKAKRGDIERKTKTIRKEQKTFKPSDKSYKKSNLIRNHHVKFFECSICSMKYTTRTSRLTHYNIVHQKITKFSCDLCSFRCFSKTSIKLHMLQHFKLRSLSIHRNVCDVGDCFINFRTRQDLSVHIAAKHAGDWPFVCWCSKRFKRLISYKAHAHHKHNVFRST